MAQSTLLEIERTVWPSLATAWRFAWRTVCAGKLSEGIAFSASPLGQGGHSNSIAESPPQLQSPPNKLFFQTQLLAPRRHALGSPLNGEKTVRASIVCLLLAGCPVAVLGTIVSVVVTAFEAFAFRTGTHVFKEGGKRIRPRLINSDTASAIVMVIEGIWVAASVVHGLPRTVFWAWGALRRSVSMFCWSTLNALEALLHFEIGTPHCVNVPALASAYPGGLSSFVDTRSFKYGPLANLLARQVNEVSHGNVPDDILWQPPEVMIALYRSAGNG